MLSTKTRGRLRKMMGRSDELDKVIKEIEQHDDSPKLIEAARSVGFKLMPAKHGDDLVLALKGIPDETTFKKNLMREAMRLANLPPSEKEEVDAFFKLAATPCLSRDPKDWLKLTIVKKDGESGYNPQGDPH
ncbi:hypothetical protein JX266_014319 [Neoarthrinium moseri]|nr:hypothetical protein JX266_014319 [Neoarthrinium moseri]